MRIRKCQFRKTPRRRHYEAQGPTFLKRMLPRIQSHRSHRRAFDLKCPRGNPGRESRSATGVESCIRPSPFVPLLCPHTHYSTTARPEPIKDYPMCLEVRETLMRNTFLGSKLHILVTCGCQTSPLQPHRSVLWKRNDQSDISIFTIYRFCCGFKHAYNETPHLHLCSFSEA